MREGSLHSYHKEIASSWLFPVFRYNPDSMTMIVSNGSATYFFLLVKLILLWSLATAVIFYGQERDYAIVISCIAQCLLVLYSKEVPNAASVDLLDHSSHPSCNLRDPQFPRPRPLPPSGLDSFRAQSQHRGGNSPDPQLLGRR